jgi:hypothetical protein
VSLQANLLCPGTAINEAFLWSTMNTKLVFFRMVIWLCSRPIILLFPPSVIGLIHAQRVLLRFVNKLAPVFYQSSTANFDAVLETARKTRRRWKDDIKIDLTETGLGCGLDSSGSGYEQVAGSCEHGDEPSGSIKGREFLD